MSELINNARKRKELLKHMILQLHSGEAPEQVRARLEELLGSIPYGEVVEVEQELIAEGLPQEEVLKFCDIHTQVLDGKIDHSNSRSVPSGHPADTFKNENLELLKLASEVRSLCAGAARAKQDAVAGVVLKLRGLFNLLWDVDKHYRRKENLLFPFLEQKGITGPPTVMWGKHDQTRELLKAAREALGVEAGMSPDELAATAELLLLPAVQAVEDMTMKEDEILLPMCLDQLTDLEWYEIYRQTPEIGFCLYDPQTEWRPGNIEEAPEAEVEGDGVRLPSGMITPAELTAILNTVPFDLTFVDKDDKVKYLPGGRAYFRQEPRHSRSRCPALPSTVEREYRGPHPRRFPEWEGEQRAILDSDARPLHPYRIFRIARQGRKLSGNARSLAGSDGQ